MPSRKTMNVSLTPELKRYVAERIASGRYRSASEVVRAALRLLEKDEREGLRHKSRTGLQKTGDGDDE
jgi:antitoxin ParD1/3/4